MIKSPRILRPDTITVKNKYKEIDFQMQYLETTINHVRVDESYGIRQSKKGIDSEDSAVIVIDLNDLEATQDNEKADYIENKDNLDLEKGLFTFKGDDIILYNDKEYTITKVNVAKRGLNKEPVFLEVFVK